MICIIQRPMVGNGPQLIFLAMSNRRRKSETSRFHILRGLWKGQRNRLSMLFRHLSDTAFLNMGGEFEIESHPASTDVGWFIKLHRNSDSDNVLLALLAAPREGLLELVLMPRSEHRSVPRVRGRGQILAVVDGDSATHRLPAAAAPVCFSPPNTERASDLRSFRGNVDVDIDNAAAHVPGGPCGRPTHCTGSILATSGKRNQLLVLHERGPFQ